MPGSVALSLGPRILRADTAAVAALALVQTAIEGLPGDGGRAGPLPVGRRPGTTGA